MTLKVRNAGNWNVVNSLRVFTSGVWNYAKVIRVYTDSFGWVVSYPDKPVVTGTVFIEGSPFVGETLSISPFYSLIFDGTRNVLPSSFSIVWQKSLNGTGPWEDTAVTNTNYNLTSFDTNYSFRVKVTGTNAKGSTDYFTNAVGPVSDPTHTFFFGDQLKIDTNAFIMINNDNIPIPNSALVSGKVLRYFTGDYKQYDLWYKSDLNQIRFIHRLYRADQSRQIAIDFEIRFFQGSQNVWVFVRNAVATQYIFGFDSGSAWGYQFNVARVNSNSYPSHIAGWRYSVPMNSGAITAIQSISNETPSTANGWIQLSNQDDQDDRRTTLETKSNMFYPTTPTVANATYSTTTSANVSWSGSNANSYRVVLANSSLQTISSFNTTSTSANISGLTVGTSYFILIYPNSRADFTGQEGFFGGVSYTHAQAPSEPTNLTATAVSDSQVNLSWSAPLNNGGANISGYIVEYKKNTDSTWTVSGTLTELNTSTPIFNLSASTLYNFRVAAKNVNSGYGPYATVNATTKAPAVVPGTPQNFSGTSTADGTSVSLSWTAPANDGGAAITKYEFQRNQSSTPGPTWLDLGLVTSYTSSSTTAGTLYYFRVRAVNSAGSGDYAQIAVTTNTPTAPGIPSGLTATSSTDGTSVTVTWTAPSDGGSPITSYEFQRNQSPTAGTSWINVGNVTSWVSSPTTSSTLYYFRVRAINAVGTGSFALTSVTTNSASTPTPTPTTPTPTTPTPTTPTPTTPTPTTPTPTTPTPTTPTAPKPPPPPPPLPPAPPSPPPPRIPGSSLGPETRVLTSSYGYIAVKYLSVGDELVSIDISEVPKDGSKFNVDSWQSETFTNNGFVTTTVTNIFAREVIGNAIRINGEWFTDNHNILSEKDGVYRFTQAIELDTTYKVFDYDLMDWRQVDDFEIISNVSSIVYVVDCEPYDVFFTENALVYNVREYL